MLFVAALAIASAACAREEVLDGGQTRGELRTFTCSFDEETQTKTDITKQGKTVWSEGDKIFVTNGTESDTLTVDSKFAGQRYFEFSTTLEGKIYVVYPCTAAKEVKDGKFTLEVPSNQNGLFGSANIACAVAEDRYVKMKNVTSVLRFKVSADAAAAVKVVSINSVNNKVSGLFSVDMTSGSPVVSTIEGNTYSSDVTVAVDGNNGNAFYATVIPGTYTAGFTMTAVTLDLHNASESKSTVSDKDLAVNAYYDLGTIGDALKPLAGEGTQGNPWQISSLADFLAFAYYVNDGNNMKDQYVRLMENIKNVTTPVGYYDASINVKKQFIGDFDGNGKTVSLNINQTARKSCGLFGAIAEGANIHDVTVEGTVNSTFDDAAGVCGLVNADNGAKITNCVNKANVTSTSNYIGGIAGWIDSKANFVIDNCSNEGNIAGAKAVGGICGSIRTGAIRNSKNSGAVGSAVNNGDINDAGAYGIGGIAGFMNGANATNCSNSGEITCVNKAGGIVGHGSWYTVDHGHNTGKIISKEYGVNGGIAGSAYDVASILNCLNEGEIIGEDKSGWTGGIVGTAQASNKKNPRYIKITNCTNKGCVIVHATAGKTQGVGGIVGYTYTYSSDHRPEVLYCVNNGDVTVDGTGSYVGGIVGYSYHRVQYAMTPIKWCLNTGNITGNIGVAGILGYLDGYNAQSRTDLENCENRGNILTNGQHAGGIFGGCKKNITRAGVGVLMMNCLNSGNVQYSNAAQNNPNVGGIAGFFAGGQLKNSYTSGKVGLLEGTEAENASATIGAVVGNVYNTNTIVQNTYYREDACPRMVGTSAALKPEEALNCSVSADGVLATTVTIRDVAYNTIVDVLNAWVNGNANYYVWTTGPKFSLTGNVNIGDGLDLGNGGKL